MSILIELKAPEGAGSVSHNGETYEVVGGIVKVPEGAVELLASHGFIVLGAVEFKDDEPEKHPLPKQKAM